MADPVFQNEELKDIRDIPFFAFSPGVYEWLALLIAFIAALILTGILKRQKYSNFKAIDNALRELSKINGNFTHADNAKELLYSASIIFRRLISFLEKDDFSNMSGNEIHQRSSSAHSRAKPALEAMIEVEKYKYSPNLKPDDAKRLVGRLIAEANRYRDLEVEKAKER